MKPKQLTESTTHLNTALIMQESSPELVQKIMQQQDDELSKIDTPQKNNQADLYDESVLGSDAEVLERIEKRFAHSLPCQRMNVILLMDMSHKQASQNQFKPLQKWKHD